LTVEVVRVSGTQLRKSLEARGVTFTEDTLPDGRSRALGQGRSGTTRIELIPSSGVVNLASISLTVGERLSDRDIRENAALMSDFLKEAVPDWPEAGSWLVSAFAAVEKGQRTVEVRRSGAAILLTSGGPLLTLRVEQESAAPAR
jgi:hypothetical protein